MNILVPFVVASLITIIVERVLGLTIVTKSSDMIARTSINISTLTSMQLQDNLTEVKEENHSNCSYLFGFYSNSGTYKDGYHYFIAKDVTEATEMAKKWQENVNLNSLPAYRVIMDFTGERHEILKRQIKPGRLQL